MPWVKTHGFNTMRDVVLAAFFAPCRVIFSFSGKIVRNMAKMMTKRAYGKWFRCAAPCLGLNF